MFDEPLVKLDCLAHYGDMRYHLILFTRLITNNFSICMDTVSYSERKLTLEMTFRAKTDVTNAS